MTDLLELHIGSPWPTACIAASLPVGHISEVLRDAVVGLDGALVLLSGGGVPPVQSR